MSFGFNQGGAGLVITGLKVTGSRPIGTVGLLSEALKPHQLRCDKDWTVVDIYISVVEAPGY